MTFPDVLRHKRDRDDLAALAADCGVTEDIMAAEIVAAWLDLARDAPAALPGRDPYVSIRARARSRGGAHA